MSQVDDVLLVSRVILFNDKRAFDALVVKYQSSIRRFFMQVTLGNRELSDDLSQEAFIKAYLHITSFRGAARFSTWLYRISYNVFYDFTKKTNLETGMDLVDLHGAGYEHDPSDTIHKKLDIYDSLKFLRNEEKTAVLLFYMEDMTHEKIAHIMSCPLGTVKSYILRGKEKLAIHFKNSGYERSI
jgi:RNA polymerase sigma-70 factor (ECF subfamily)